MNKNVINIIVVLAIIVIVVIVMADYTSTRPGRGPANPFAFDVTEYTETDPELIKWKETRQIQIADGEARAIATKNSKLYLATNNELQIISSQYELINSTSIPAAATAIDVNEHSEVVVALTNYVIIYNNLGEITKESVNFGADTKFTSVVWFNNDIYLADAHGRKVVILNSDLELKGEFRGESGISALHGFIVPGAHFFLAVNSENELWITNPGMHSLQNYNSNGSLRSYISISSYGIEGFSGCCNPEFFTFLPNGEFITSEKGIIRIKVLKESGELISVVAPPEKFSGGTRAPMITSDESGHIYALDFDRNMIRVFEPI